MDLIAAVALGAAVWLWVSDHAPRKRVTLILGQQCAAPALSLRALAVRVMPGARWGAHARREASRHRMSAVALLAAIASELRAGHSPHAAVERGALGASGAYPVLWAAARHRGDVASALEVESAHGGTALRDAAVAWRVAAASGAGLAQALTALVASARDAEELRTQVEAQLASPRATARMLAGLPILGLAMGVLLGADPLAWLMGSSAGWACLLGGVALTGLGVAWTTRIGAQVTAQL